MHVSVSIVRSLLLGEVYTSMLDVLMRPNSQPSFLWGRIAIIDEFLLLSEIADAKGSFQQLCLFSIPRVNSVSRRKHQRTGHHLQVDQTILS